MRRQEQLGTLALLGGAILVLVVLAAGLSTVELQGGRPFPLGDLQRLLAGLTTSVGDQAEAPRLPPMLRWLFRALVWILIPGLVLSLVLSPNLRKAVLRRFLIGVAWTALIVLAARAWQQARERSDGPAGARETPPRLDLERLPPAPGFITDPPRWLVVAISLFVAALLVAGIVFLLRRSRAASSPLGRIAEEAEQALDDLRAGGDLRDTIVRCYAEMSRVLEDRGTVQRRLDMTPREFEQRLAATGLRDEHIHRLTRLFEAVRYGARSPGAGCPLGAEQEAEDCLSAIVRAYGKPPSARASS